MKTTMLRMAEQMVNTPHRMATAREFLGRDKLVVVRVLKDLIDDFTKSDFKSFWDDFEIFKIVLKYGDLI
jgi:hypothetical protein